MAAKRNLSVVKGDDYTHNVTIQDNAGTPWDLTGYTGEAHIRRRGSESELSSPTLAFTVSVLSPETDGKITMSLTSTETDTLSTTVDYVYDLELTDSGGSVTTILLGDFEVIQDVTH